MNYLLDTCVLSEFSHRKPGQKVIQWIGAIDEDKLFINVITVGEVQRGIERLPESKLKTELLGWMNTGLIKRFGQRIIPLENPNDVSVEFAHRTNGRLEPADSGDGITHRGAQAFPH